MWPAAGKITENHQTCGTLYSRTPQKWAAWLPIFSKRWCQCRRWDRQPSRQKLCKPPTQRCGASACVTCCSAISFETSVSSKVLCPRAYCWLWNIGLFGPFLAVSLEHFWATDSFRCKAWWCSQLRRCRPIQRRRASEIFMQTASSCYIIIWTQAEPAILSLKKCWITVEQHQLSLSGEAGLAVSRIWSTGGEMSCGVAVSSWVDRSRHDPHALLGLGGAVRSSCASLKVAPSCVPCGVQCETEPKADFQVLVWPKGRAVFWFPGEAAALCLPNWGRRIWRCHQGLRPIEWKGTSATKCNN